MTMMTGAQETVLAEFHTLTGARNYIARLGYERGVAVRESFWNGNRTVPVMFMLDVSPRRNGSLFEVVRYVQHLEG